MCYAADYVKKLRAAVGHDPVILNGAKVLVIDGQGRLLLQKRKDGCWDLPGGLMELGESLEDTARRELKEEANIEIGELKLLGVYSGPEYFVTLPNWDQYYAVTAAYVTNDFSGRLQPDGVEGVELRFFDRDAMPDKINPKMMAIIGDFIKL
ncbi:ADP-ribose pyrophosphatase YjhB, NUDIX family [Desulfotomaculum arcticum]|uniref:ADP-ribose pyrophosphatase YjhB, NUDIX family n=1 Tax=Desulfotruncus arcticus DSM 17038 TaxID=1121424 RepID=A0A1I2UXB7_9FIRM|nr:NUDIX hydrolase [Desulfotruncus arcticus]SFG80859.1 ADP-ribose pyrophosphatase YjhB, NUDIX family [Desulfotomaculum arcticum] [Desulfotruncus arcticus DSM 17038]